MLKEAYQLHKDTYYHHWHYLRHRRSVSAKVNTHQIIGAQIFTVVVSIVGGVLLESNKLNISAFAGALILYPGIIDLITSVTGVLGSKLNHHLEGTEQKRSVIVFGVLIMAFGTIFLTSIILGLSAGLLGLLFGSVGIPKLMILSVATAVVVGVILFPLMCVGVLLLRSHKINPDNIIGPIESSVVDVVATLVFIIIIGLMS